MKQIIPLLVFTAFACASCGTGKKLEAANQKIAGLNAKFDSLVKVNGDMQQSLAQLKTENDKSVKDAEDCKKMKEAYAARVARFNESLEENGNSMEKIKDKIAASLATFKDEGLTVR